MATKQKSRVGRFLLVTTLLIGAGWAVTNMARHRVGHAEDTVAKWAEPRRMTKPTTAERPNHKVRFIVEALPERDLLVHAIAGIGQSFGPTSVEAGRWSWTAPGVRTGEYAELTAEELSNIERGALRCWIEIDGKVYRNAGDDHPYEILRDTSNGDSCSVIVVVG